VGKKVEPISVTEGCRVLSQIKAMDRPGEAKALCMDTTAGLMALHDTTRDDCMRETIRRLVGMLQEATGLQ